MPHTGMDTDRFQHSSDRLLCVIGLGNPGLRYRDNKHNVGFRVIDRYAERIGIETFEHYTYMHSGVKTVMDSVLMVCKPMTYMNLSGNAVKSLVDDFGWEPERFLVVYDDVSIPLGSLRLRAKGSSGGHNGLESIIETLRISAIPRLRFGVGPINPVTDLADFVLSDFTAEQERIVDETVERACDAITHSIIHGIERTMNVFNSQTITNQE